MTAAHLYGLQQGNGGTGNRTQDRMLGGHTITKLHGQPPKDGFASKLRICPTMNKMARPHLPQSTQKRKVLTNDISTKMFSVEGVQVRKTSSWYPQPLLPPQPQQPPGQVILTRPKLSLSIEMP